MGKKKKRGDLGIWAVFIVASPTIRYEKVREFPYIVVRLLWLPVEMLHITQPFPIFSHVGEELRWFVRNHMKRLPENVACRRG
jgi:hypothetical protein